MDTDHILEMACIITDGDMNIVAEVCSNAVHMPSTNSIAIIILNNLSLSLSLSPFFRQGPDVIVHQPDSVLDAMGPWCREHHGRVSAIHVCE